MRPEPLGIDARTIEAGGLRLATAADLGGEAVYPALYEVSKASAADIPRSLPYVPLSYDAWRGWLRPPAVLPERVWVALSGDEPVGYSYLYFGSTPVTTGYTGVLREHRGKGAARALKLATLAQAVELGAESVETDNDAENAPILHLNEELGYREVAGMLQLYKRLAAPAEQ